MKQKIFLPKDINKALATRLMRFAKEMNNFCDKYKYKVIKDGDKIRLKKLEMCIYNNKGGTID